MIFLSMKVIYLPCQNPWLIDGFGFIGGKTLPDLFLHQIEVSPNWLLTDPRSPSRR